MSLTAGGGQSWVVGKSDRVPTTESAGVQAMPSLGPPWHLFEPAQEPAAAPGQSASVLHGPLRFVPAMQVWLHTGQTWMPGAFGNRSPSRKISELSGRLRAEAPVEQSAVPLALLTTVLMTHTLVGVLARVRFVPLHEDTAVSELPISGT